MEPIFLEPVYKEIIWGGTNFLKMFKRDYPSDKLAESWEICVHENGINNVINGQYKGMPLGEVFNDKLTREAIFGIRCNNLDKFPILTKFIDASENLSIQVHPDNEYALTNESSLGKTEMWYIVWAKPNAKIIYGTKENVTKEEMRLAIENKTVSDLINYVDVKAGDVVCLPAGTIHAILDGIIIYEVQQNSDLTYRVYAWGMKDIDGKPRQLHVEKAMDVINFDFKGEIQNTDNISGEIVVNEYFKVDKICIKDNYYGTSDKKTFHAYTAIEGKGTLKYNEKEYELRPGMSFIIPAVLGDFEIESINMELIRTSII